MSRSENNSLNLKLTPGGSRINRNSEYFTGKFPNEELIQARIMPPKNGHYTPEQAVRAMETQGQIKLKQVDKLAESIIKENQKQGYKGSRIDSKMAYKIAGEAIEQDWKANFDRQLKNRYGEKSREYFIFSENSTDKVQVSIGSLKSWKSEALKLQRPSQHIDFIDREFSQASRAEERKTNYVQAGSETSRLEEEKRQHLLLINRQASEIMKKDKQDYQKLRQYIKSQSEQNQQQGIDTNKTSNNTEKVQVSINSVKSWRNEAEALKRPKSHLKGIDNVMTQGKKVTVGNKKMVEMSKNGWNYMQKDKQDYQKLREENKHQTIESQTLRR